MHTLSYEAICVSAIYSRVYLQHEMYIYWLKLRQKYE